MPVPSKVLTGQIIDEANDVSPKKKDSSKDPKSIAEIKKQMLDE